MIDKSKIKVVKRADVPEKKKRKRVERSRNAARKIVNNVTEWVTDLKVRKSDETRAAIDALFASRPEPSGS